MMEQRVDERAVGVAGGGMDDEAGGFVEDDEIVVLEEDVKGDVLGDGLHGHGIGNRDGHDIAGMQLRTGFHDRGVERDRTVLDQCLNPRARQIRESGDKELIEAAVRLFGGDFKTMFGGGHVRVFDDSGPARKLCALAGC